MDLGTRAVNPPSVSHTKSLQVSFLLIRTIGISWVTTCTRRIMEVLCRRLARTESKCLSQMRKTYISHTLCSWPTVSTARPYSHISQSVHRRPRIKLYVTSRDRKHTEDKTPSTTAHVHISMANRFGVISIVQTPN